MDIPLTRTLVAQMDAWLDRLVKRTGLPKAQLHKGAPVYRFAESSSQVVEIAKAVRIVSGLNACLLLADMGYLAEVATLLRTLGDFANEIMFLFEGSCRVEGPTNDQRRFVEDFFASVPTTVEELQSQERRRWVSREEIYKSHGRLAEKTPGVDKSMLKASTLLIDLLLNAYAHGGYAESMDLYNGAVGRFETRGVPDEVHERTLKRYLCQKTYYCGVVFGLMAHERGLTDLVAEIDDALMRLGSAPEYLGEGEDVG